MQKNARCRDVHNVRGQLAVQHSNPAVENLPLFRPGKPRKRPERCLTPACTSTADQNVAAGVPLKKTVPCTSQPPTPYTPYTHKPPHTISTMTYVQHFSLQQSAQAPAYIQHFDTRTKLASSRHTSKAVPAGMPALMHTDTTSRHLLLYTQAAATPNAAAPAAPEVAAVCMHTAAEVHASQIQGALPISKPHCRWKTAPASQQVPSTDPTDHSTAA